MVRIITVLFFLLFPFILLSQGNGTQSNDIFEQVQVTDTGEGTVMIYQDFRINELVDKHIKANQHEGGIPGFRIRIYSSSARNARDESIEVQARFNERFPDIAIHREFQTPSYYKVYVGDFRTKDDALKIFKEIKRYYRTAFIVEDKINLPNLD